MVGSSPLQRRQGFSLTEMLVVLGIILLLMSLSIPMILA